MFSPAMKAEGLSRLRAVKTMPDSVAASMRQRFMTIDQITELIRDGFDIGSHGIHHYPLISLTQEEKIVELDKDWIKRLVPSDRLILSLPFGSHQLSDLSLCNGYDFILTTKNTLHKNAKIGDALGLFAILDENQENFTYRLTH